MPIKIIIFTFIVFVISRIYFRYRKKEITFLQALAWFFFWLMVLGASLLPKTTDIFAQYAGIGRGADLLIFASIITLFFISFKIIVKQEKINRDITKIVRKMALDEKKDKNDLKDSERNF